MPIQQTINISRAYRDININFKRNPVTGDLVILKNEDAIKKSVINLIRTRFNERFFQPRIGTTIESMLFELDSNSLKIETAIINDVQTVLKNYEPRVSLTETIVNISPDENSLEVKVIYDIVGEPTPPQVATVLLIPTRL